MYVEFTWQNRADPDQTASEEQSVIRVFPVCYSDKHFVKTRPENQQKEKSVPNLRTFTVSSVNCVSVFRMEILMA